MEVYSVDITAFTSSFRQPMLISGPQLTLEVPPVSTILGLINAAAGRYLRYNKCFIGYYFEYKAKAVDVETIYMAEVSNNGHLLAGTRSNIVRREILFDTFLRLYSPHKEVIDNFRVPFFPLILGRSCDLATVDSRSFLKKDLKERKNADQIKGQVIPFSKGFLPGRIQPLSQYFTNTIPREMLGKQPYSVVSYAAQINSPLQAYRDEINGRQIDIFFHEINSDDLY